MARPRIYPANEDRQKRSRSAVQERGGRIIQITLHRDELAKLEAIQQQFNLSVTQAIRHALAAWKASGA